MHQQYPHANEINGHASFHHNSVHVAPSAADPNSGQAAFASSPSPPAEMHLPQNGAPRRAKKFAFPVVCGCLRAQPESIRPSSQIPTPSPAPQYRPESEAGFLPRATKAQVAAASSSSVQSSPQPSAAAAQLITQVTPDGSLQRANVFVRFPESAVALVDSRKGGAPLLGAQTGSDRGKKTLVLDLDETLVHSSFKPVNNCAFQIKVEIEGQVHDIYVCKRPGVDEFLQKSAEFYEIVIFTASLEKYANPVMNLLDPLRVCTWRLFRESCTQMYIHGQGAINYVKDLSRLGRDLRQVIIVDNSPFAYALQPENAIPIKSWFEDTTDRELYELLPILEELSKVDDIPHVMRQAVSAKEE